MGVLFAPLDDVLASRGKLRLLRALFRRDLPVSGREAARLAGMSHPAALQALGDLGSLGILLREETPAQYLYLLNREHRLVRYGLDPLFRTEEAWIGEVFDAIREVLDGGTDEAAEEVVSACVFGSAARGEDRPGSDFDVLVVVRDEAFVEPVHGRLVEESSRLRREFGLEISPVVLSLSRLHHLHHEQAPLVSAVLADGRTVLGRPIADVLNG